jgi:hypothetical protein
MRFDVLKQSHAASCRQWYYHRPITAIIGDRETLLRSRLSEHSTMALHYFHHSNGRTTLDLFGTDLPDLVSVRKEAIRALRELIYLGPADDLWSGEPWKVWVTQDAKAVGPTILTLELAAR